MEPIKRKFIPVGEERVYHKNQAFPPVDVKTKEGEVLEMLTISRAVYHRDKATGRLTRLNPPQNKHERRKAARA